MPEALPRSPSLEDVASATLQAQARGARVVFTNGCFDLIHAGHVRCLEQARGLGDLLVVAVNGDASIGRLKGPTRPYVSEDERLFIVASLRCVDHALLFDDDTPLRLIERIRPNVLVKGGDYEGTRVVGQDVVEGYGGKVTFIGLLEGRSTTNLVATILGRQATAQAPGRRG